MIARHDVPDYRQPIDGMNQEQLVNLIVFCGVPTLHGEIDSRMCYSDQLPLKRLAIQTQLQAAHSELNLCND